MSTMPTAVIVDDHPAIADGFRRMLRTHIRVVGTAEDAPSGVAVAAQHRPDIVTMDVGMPGQCWIATERIVQEVGSKVLVVTGKRLESIADQAFGAGASGIVAKGARPEALRAAIFAVIHGETFVGAEWESRGESECPVLDSTELHLLELLSELGSQQLVADHLGSSTSRVGQRVAELRERFGAKNDVQLVTRAFDCGTLTTG